MVTKETLVVRGRKATTEIYERISRSLKIADHINTHEDIFHTAVATSAFCLLRLVL